MLRRSDYTRSFGFNVKIITCHVNAPDDAPHIGFETKFSELCLCCKYAASFKQGQCVGPSFGSSLIAANRGSRPTEPATLFIKIRAFIRSARQNLREGYRY